MDENMDYTVAAMDSKSFFFKDSIFIPYVSFVINRPRFTRWKVQERTIEDHELVLIADGHGVLRVGGEALPCAKGTLLYLHYDQWHSLEADPGSTINFYSVHFSFLLARHSHESWTYCEDINYYLKNEKRTGQNWSFNRNPGLLPFDSTMSVENYAKVEDLYIQLNRAYHEKEAGYPLKLSILCQELIYEVCRQSLLPADRKINMMRLEQTVEYIDRHYAQRIRLKDLCACAHLSESNLIKLFKQNLGKTPVEYINRVRVNKAKELLLYTSRCIKEIAYRTGFADEFYFSRVFKKMEGKSPRNYRHQMLS
jgi:AraC family transcriptional regulator, transcriptional activator for feuABC-ybbA operon